jgi:phage-related protein
MVHVGMGDEPKRLPAAFWRSASKVEPVRECLQSLAKDDRYEIGTAIKTVEFGWPIGMPVCRPMGDGLWEVRASLARGRIARLLFCVHGGRMILLHGFMKKTQRTPKHDLALARDRKRQLESGGTR